MLVLGLNGYHAAGQGTVHFHWQARQGVLVDVPWQDDKFLLTFLLYAHPLPCFLPFTQNIFRQPMPENS